MTQSNIILSLILVISAFVGYKIINRVPSLLHTPLMSGMNAFSGITLLGCMTIANYTDGIISKIMAVTAIVLATINIVAGFAVTDRMLKMFKKGRN